MFVGVFFLERVIFTHLSACLFVTGRHKPSRIVAVRANLATRLGSSRSVNFFRGRCTLPEVHFRYPFSRHDFRYDGRDPSRSVANRHPFCDPLRIGYIGHEWLKASIKLSV